MDKLSYLCPVNKLVHNSTTSDMKAENLFFLGAKISFDFTTVKEYDDATSFKAFLVSNAPTGISSILWEMDFSVSKDYINGRFVDEGFADKIKSEKRAIKHRYRDMWDFAQIVYVGDTLLPDYELDENGLPNPSDTIVRYWHEGNYQNILVSSDNPDYRVLTTVGAVIPFSLVEDFDLHHDDVIDDDVFEE